MAKQPLLRITFSPTDLRLRRVFPRFGRATSKRIRRLKDDSLKAFTSKIHSRSGRTVRAIKTKVNLDKKTLTGSIVIDYSATAIKFLDKGTRASPGAYIPKFGRRYKKENPNKRGIHPGIRATNIVDRALADIEILIGKTARTLERDWEFSFRKR